MRPPGVDALLVVGITLLVLVVVVTLGLAAAHTVPLPSFGLGR